MVLEYLTDPKGLPQAIASGASPTFAADLSELATYFGAGRTFRKVATQAALNSATGMEDGDLALVDNIPGAWFRYNGTSWPMFGTPTFASTGARDSAITAPVAGDRARVGTTVYRYVGSTWVVWDQGWTSWTPTLQSFNSLGTGGAASGQYYVVNGFLHFDALIQFGTASIGAIQSNRGFSMPIAPHATWDDKEHRIGNGLFRDVSVTDPGAANAILGLAVFWTPYLNYGVMRQLYSGSSGVADYEYYSGGTGGFPTLGSGDYITFEGSYPLAGAF